MTISRPMMPESHRSEEHTSELQSQSNLVCRLLLEKKKQNGWRLYPGARQENAAAGAGRGVQHGRLKCAPVRRRQRADLRLRVAGFAFFFFKGTATTEIYTLSLHDALPISRRTPRAVSWPRSPASAWSARISATVI